VSQVPEAEAIQGEEAQAAHQQGPHVRPPGNPQVDRDPDADDGGNGHVGIGQEHRPELVDEQRVADRLTDREAADDEEEIRKYLQTRGSRPQIEDTFERLSASCCGSLPEDGRASVSRPRVRVPGSPGQIVRYRLVGSESGLPRMPAPDLS
jgi:hypothetical protein